MRTLILAAACAASSALVPVSGAQLLAEEKQSANDAQMQAAAKVVQGSLDKWRARDFEGWLAMYSPNVVVAAENMTLVGKAELRGVYKLVFDANLKTPNILDSGWTGQRIFVVQEEFGPNGEVIGTTYAEYEVKGGKITAVYGSAQG